MLAKIHMCPHCGHDITVQPSDVQKMFLKAGLNDQERTVLDCLRYFEEISREEMIDALWPAVATRPRTYTKLVNVLTCALRKKLKPFGYTVKMTVDGRGRGKKSHSSSFRLLKL